MSELEIRKRQEYKKNRKKWTVIQIVALLLLLVISLSMFLVYDRMSRTYYIEYTENSNIDYKVQYNENDFFDSLWIDKGQEYISFLINQITASFNYELNMEESGIGFDYNHRIDAKLVVADKSTGNPYYSIEENLMSRENSSRMRSNGIAISESILIDYNKYDDIATNFIAAHDLKNASATLIVTLNVDVISSSDKFENSNKNTYSTALNIPLAKETFSIHFTSSVPTGESKVIAYSGGENRQVFYIIGTVSLVLAILLFAALMAFLHITRNEDITYSAKVRRLLSAYSSYIQRINGDFNDEGYQTVMIKTFNEMLGIRDTLQAPILMTENRDETMTRFLIPTNTKLLYVFEIKVENYDAIYSTIKKDEEDLSEEINEAMKEPDVILSEIDYVPDDDDDYVPKPEEPGVEVVGVVWPERPKRNKVYRYDPNGKQLSEGDIVLVPTSDVASNKEVIRKAAVAHGNHRVEPEHIKHPLKKIITIIKRKAEVALTSSAKDEKNKK